MKYILYNCKTRQSIYFNSSKDLHKWIKSHFRLMSYRQMSVFTVCRASSFDMLSSDGVVLQAVLRSRIADLPDYILSHLH